MEYFSNLFFFHYIFISSRSGSSLLGYWRFSLLGLIKRWIFPTAGYDPILGILFQVFYRCYLLIIISIFNLFLTFWYQIIKMKCGIVFIVSYTIKKEKVIIFPLLFRLTSPISGYLSFRIKLFRPILCPLHLCFVGVVRDHTLFFFSHVDHILLMYVKKTILYSFILIFSLTNTRRFFMTSLVNFHRDTIFIKLLC